MCNNDNDVAVLLQSKYDFCTLSPKYEVPNTIFQNMYQKKLQANKRMPF